MDVSAALSSMHHHIRLYLTHFGTALVLTKGTLDKKNYVYTIYWLHL